jgi:hypothetical protein
MIGNHPGKEHRPRAGDHIFLFERRSDDVEKFQAGRTDSAGLAQRVGHEPAFLQDLVGGFDEVGVVGAMAHKQLLEGHPLEAHDLHPADLLLPIRGPDAFPLLRPGLPVTGSLNQGLLFFPGRQARRAEGAVADNDLRLRGRGWQGEVAHHQGLAQPGGMAVPGILPLAQIIVVPRLRGHQTDFHPSGQGQADGLLNLGNRQPASGQGGFQAFYLRRGKPIDIFAERFDDVQLLKPTAGGGYATG